MALSAHFVYLNVVFHFDPGTVTGFSQAFRGGPNGAGTGDPHRLVVRSFDLVPLDGRRLQSTRPGGCFTVIESGRAFQRDIVSWRSRVKSLVGAQALPVVERERVLLTFDDGPHPESTPLTLEVLKKYNVRAVFFVVGSRVHRAPEMLARIVSEGHALGNHSYSHELAEIATLASYRQDLQRCQDLIAQLAGCRPRLFRPPLGELTISGVRAARALNLRSVFWSADSDDWRMRSTDDVPRYAAMLESQLSRRPLREIVLLHDERPFTAMLLDRILPELVKRGVDLHSGVESL